MDCFNAAGPVGTTRTFHCTISQGTLQSTQAKGTQFHPSCVTGRLAVGEVEDHTCDWDQLEPELDAWNEHQLAEQRRRAAVLKLRTARQNLLQRVRSRHRQELTRQPSLDVQRLQQQVHREKMALLAKSIRADNAQSSTRPSPPHEASADPAASRHRGRSRDRQASLKAAQTQRSVGSIAPRPNVDAARRRPRARAAPQESLQMTGSTLPGGHTTSRQASGSPTRLASRGRYAGEPASSPEVAVGTKVQYRAQPQEASPRRRPGSTEAADKRARERLDSLRLRFKLSPAEAKKLQATSVKLDRLAFQVQERRIHLPQLCMCHMTPPLQPEYPYLCAANCALHRNPSAYEALLKSLLAAYGISLKDAEL